MRTISNWIKGHKKESTVLFSVFLFFGLISISVYVASREVGDLRSFAQYASGIRPTCNSHNDCPANWMYCSAGECWSYATGPGVGGSCGTDSDCVNTLLHCINGSCQRVVGDPGGCSNSFDCVDQYKGGDNEGRWSCTNSQCIKMVQASKKYWNGEELVSYGTTAACIHTSDCGPGAICDEYGCHLFINKQPCYSMYECAKLHSDPNKRYVCVDSFGELIDRNSNVGGTCEERDACDSSLITCGPGTHCRPTTFGSVVVIRTGKCFPDEGTTALNGQPPEGWQTIECGEEDLIERCSNNSDHQRVRFCRNDLSNAVRWNRWIGTNKQRCVKGGELWGHSGQSLSDRKGLGVPEDFYDASGCPYTGTRISRCSNTVEGQLVSFCSTDRKNPERSIKRQDNWSGPNGITCSKEGMVIPNASVQTHHISIMEENTPTLGGNQNQQQQSQGSGSSRTTMGGIFRLLFNLLGNSQGVQECTGDVNGDGIVDREDFNILLDNWYSEDTIIALNGSSVNIDLNNDGIVDIQDVRIVLDDFGCEVE